MLRAAQLFTELFMQPIDKHAARDNTSCLGVLCGIKYAFRDCRWAPRWTHKHSTEISSGKFSELNMLKQTSRSFIVIWRVISQQIQLTLEIKYTFPTLKKCFSFYPSPDLRKTWRPSSLPKPYSFLNKVAEHRASCNSTVSQKYILIKNTKQSLRECRPMEQEINTL